MMLFPTELKYYTDSYLKSHETTIVRYEQKEHFVNIVLDSTIFYPVGGGQPADQGKIITDSGRAEVRNVRIVNGVVLHECKLIEGDIHPDQNAKLEIDWLRRYRNMKVHTAGHIIHDVFMSIADGFIPVRGDHGSKPFLEYKTSSEFDQSRNYELEEKTNDAIEKKLAVSCREINLEELKAIAKFIPPNLPTDKPLRTVQIEGFFAMPDGGVLVKELSEIGQVKIVSITNKVGKTKIKYKVLD